MKLFKKCAIISIVFLTVLSFASCGSKHIFREVDLGMSVAQVKKAEKKSEFLGEADDQLVYHVDSIYGYKQEDMQAIYGFESDKLTEITLLITVGSGSGRDEAYQTLKTAMIEKFGSEYSTTGTWLIWKTDGATIGLTKWQEDMVCISLFTSE